jgi:transposase-like protein
MALSKSVASELLEAFRAGEGVDLIPESVQLVMQELIEAEAAERIGAGRYERSESRAAIPSNRRYSFSGNLILVGLLGGVSIVGVVTQVTR